MHTISTGVEYQVLVPGIVSLFEEHDVRVEIGYTLQEWRDLDPYDRALEVAHCRLRRQISLHREALVHESSKSHGSPGGPK